MKTTSWLAIAVSSVLGAALEAQSFNVRPGTWEISVVMEGTLPGMEKVPPDMRAQIEAQLKRPQVSQSCVTAEDIQKFDIANMGDDANCKMVSSKITATTADFTRQCTGDQPATDTAHFEAPTPETIRANLERKGAEGAMTMNMTGRWVSAECKK